MSYVMFNAVIFYLFVDTLNVPPNSFLEGRTYKIILQGRLDDWRGESGMSFLVNYPPYEGRCVANITEGKVSVQSSGLTMT